MSKSDEDTQAPDGKYAITEDTRWKKQGHRHFAQFEGRYCGGTLDYDMVEATPSLEIQPISRKGEVGLDLTLEGEGEDEGFDIGILAHFTADQMLDFADALEEAAEAARDGELAE